MSLYIQCVFGTLHVPGWTPFCLQSCLKSSSHRFNRYWYWLHDHTVAANLSAAHANFLVHHSQRCFIGLRSDKAIWMQGNLSCSKKQFEITMSFVPSQSSVNHWYKTGQSMLSLFKFWPCQPNVAEQIRTHQTHFFNGFEILASLYKL